MKFTIHIFFLIAMLVASASLTASADSVSDAVAAAKRAPRNQKLNRKAAQALADAGRADEAVDFYLKSDNRGNFDAAQILFEAYDFERAAELTDRYLSKRTKAEQEADTEDGVDAAKSLRDRAILGQGMIDRVEKIEIIDSINVDFDDFMKFYKIASMAGAIQQYDWLTRIVSDSWARTEGVDIESTSVYVAPDGEYVIFSADDADYVGRLYETSRLSDGTWETPHLLFDNNSLFDSDEGSLMKFPFMMADGVTLYFGADGPESLGGFDIFVTRRDGDRFLQPSNIGMPYNSPFNDYLYAVDEITGTGWWATERNQIADSVTVYTFKLPGDMRINYPSDTPGLADLAKVSSIALTQPADADYSTLKAEIAAIRPTVNRSKDREFAFSLPDGRVITELSQFASVAARKAMERLLDARALDQATVRQLADLRERYGKGDHSLSFRILDLEEKIEKNRDELLKLSNDVVTIEMNAK